MARGVGARAGRNAAAEILSLVLLGALASGGAGEDWPAFRHDHRRSAVTGERLALPLARHWSWKSTEPPAPLWPGPAPWDSYARKIGLRNMRDFDAAFAVTVVEGRVYFGSSSDDALHCLSAATGRELWARGTGGPVRLPPEVSGGSAWFGSDDGRVWCVDARSGAVLWRTRLAPEDRRIPRDGKLLSLWPCLTAVVVEKGRVYAGASLLPWLPSWICALDAKTGSVEGEGLWRARVEGATLEGALVCGAGRIIAPEGRMAPAVFDQASGKLTGRLGGDREAGVFAFLSDDDRVLHGSGLFPGGVSERDPRSGELVVAYPGARRLLVRADRSWIATDRELSSLDRARYHRVAAKRGAVAAEIARLEKERKEIAAGRRAGDLEAADRDLSRRRAERADLDREAADCVRWRRPVAGSQELVLAGDLLFVGGDGEVLALDAGGGEERWRGRIEGRAKALAVAGGRLFVSTDRGETIAYRAAGQGRPKAFGIQGASPAPPRADASR